MGDQTMVRQHRWAELTQQNVEVAGVDQEDIPVVIHVGDQKRGVNCMNCAQPYNTETATQPCAGMLPDD